MTREEIMRLEGRELDVAVGRIIMGMRIKCVEDRVFGRPIPLYLVATPEDDPELSEPIWNPVPFYSTRMDDAWQVVEQISGAFWLQRLGGRLYLPDCGRELEEYAMKYGRPRFRCKFGRDAAWGFGITAPEAICRAALLAVCGEAGDDG